MTQWEATYDGVSKTYAALYHTAWHLLDMAEKSKEGSLLNLQAATVFFAFSFEAYLNHVGAEELDFWPEIEQISYSAKLAVLSKYLGLVVDKSRRPFQSIIELFKFRNALAHGRTQKLSKTINTSTAPSHNAAWRLLPEEQLTTSIVCRYRDDIENAIELINAKRPKKDDNLLNQGIRGHRISRSD